MRDGLVTEWKRRARLLANKDSFADFFLALGLPKVETWLTKWRPLTTEEQRQLGLELDPALVSEAAHVYADRTTDFRVVSFVVNELSKQVVDHVVRGVRRSHGLTDVLLVLVDSGFDEAWLVLWAPGEKKVEKRVLQVQTTDPQESVLVTLEEIRERLEQTVAADEEVTALDIQAVLWRGFNREDVTDHFFEDLKKSLEAIEKETEAEIPEPRERRLFSLLLLTRLMFLYFLQKKGWIEGNTEILADLYREAREQRGNFYDEYLKPLFFEVLNRKRDERTGIAARFQRTPFLNGGLFDQTDLDRRYLSISLSNDLFLTLFNRFLDRYRFVITEHTPEFSTVSVDPEILGRVFEEFVQAEERKGKGAFSTRKEVVQFMTRIALWLYLKKRADTVPDDKIRITIFDDELPPLEEVEKAALLQALRQIKVVDPAVGSGAFLQGMLYELERLRLLLGEERPKGDLRREIIANNLYGVDIVEGFVWLCELRLWLNMIEVMEVEDVDQNPALPNLDHKIRVGDSLLQEVQGIEKTLPNDALARRKAELEREYLDSYGAQKKRLEQQLQEIERQAFEFYIDAWHKGTKQQKEELKRKLSQGELGFHWQIDFAEVFAQGGFDVAIMNPPYLRQERIDREFGACYKDRLNRYFARDSGFGFSKQSDLYVYFYARLPFLLKETGLGVMVTSAAWLDDKYGVPLQKFLMDHFKICFVFDSARERWFPRQDVITDITVLEREAHERDLRDLNAVRFVAFKGSLTDYLFERDKRFSELIQRFVSPGTWIDTDEYRVFPITQGQLLEGGKASGTEYRESKWGKFLRGPPVYWRIVERAGNKLRELSSLGDVRRGVTTGANEFFFVEDITAQLDEESLNRSFGTTREALAGAGLAVIRVKVKENGKRSVHHFLVEKRYLEPVIRSPRECTSIRVTPDMLTRRLLTVHEAKERLRGTKVLEYINWGEERGYHRRPTCSARARWYDLGERDVSPLIWFKSFNDRFLVLSNPQGFLNSDRLYSVYLDDAAVLSDLMCALLNSTITHLFVEVNGRVSLGEGALDNMTYEAGQTLVLDPKFVDPHSAVKLRSVLSTMAERPISSVFDEVRQPDREQLDDILLDLFGFADEDERRKVASEVRDAVVELVNRRLGRAEMILGEL